MRDLCASFSNTPKACRTFHDPNPVIVLEREAEGITMNALLAMIMILVTANIVLMLLYRRCTNKDLKDDMNLQVNSAVSQYFALSTKT